MRPVLHPLIAFFHKDFETKVILASHHWFPNPLLQLNRKNFYYTVCNIVTHLHILNQSETFLAPRLLIFAPIVFQTTVTFISQFGQ